MKWIADRDAACISVWISDSGSNTRTVVQSHRLKGVSFQGRNIRVALGGDGQHGFR